MSGTFNLTKPSDLLAKLQRELGRLRAEPYNADHAFNFFVTAEHILDWLHPGSANEVTRKRLRAGDPLLQVVSHLANGAKHFDRLKSHHASVTSTRRSAGYFAKPYFGKNYFGPSYFGDATLTIGLSGDAATAYGSSISALSLAEKVYAYWSVAGKVAP